MDDLKNGLTGSGGGATSDIFMCGIGNIVGSIPAGDVDEEDGTCGDPPVVETLALGGGGLLLNDEVTKLEGGSMALLLAGGCSLEIFMAAMAFYSGSWQSGDLFVWLRVANCCFFFCKSGR
jgi:hypothetical protein